MTLDEVRLRRWDAEEDAPPDEERVLDRLQARGFHASRHVYPPGTTFDEHTHEVDKIDAVLSGRFRMTAPGQEAVLEAGDWLEVPAGTPHTARVVGGEPVVTLDAKPM